MAAAFWFAITQPSPPMHLIYPIWLVNVSIFAWASWTRGSTWLVINYVALGIIDTFGLYNVLTS